MSEERFFDLIACLINPPGCCVPILTTGLNNAATRNSNKVALDMNVDRQCASTYVGVVARHRKIRRKEADNSSQSGPLLATQMTFLT